MHWGVFAIALPVAYEHGIAGVLRRALLAGDTGTLFRMLYTAPRQMAYEAGVLFFGETITSPWG
jgi:hypothetical protein